MPHDPSLPDARSDDGSGQPDPYAPPIESAAAEQAAPLPPGMLSSYPWLTFVLPFVVYMLVGTLEPPPPGDPADTSSWHLGLGIEYRHYPLIYTAKIVLTLAAMLLVLPGYRTFPFRVGWLAIAVGAVGVVVWVALCDLQLEQRLLAPLGLDALLGLGQRSGFNPLEKIPDPTWAYAFLAIRFVGLALVVPIIEEFFLRGFLMRFVVSDRWWEIPFGHATRAAILVGTAVPMLIHPGELLAAMVWFSGVTWLMLRTRNIWDCVAAHAITNLLMGIYVVTSGNWTLM